MPTGGTPPASKGPFTIGIPGPGRFRLLTPLRIIAFLSNRRIWFAL
jgi:hypothetical protein